MWLARVPSAASLLPGNFDGSGEWFDGLDGRRLLKLLQLLLDVGQHLVADLQTIPYMYFQPRCNHCKRLRAQLNSQVSTNLSVL